MKLVSTPQQLHEAASALGGARRFYIDTEFESSRQGKTLSLVQVSRGQEIYVVDALRLPDLSALAGALLEPSSEWVLHAGLQDIELLVDRFGSAPPPALFDTQVVWGLVGPEASVSLSFLQFKVLGLRSSKGHQTDDWMQRPLPDSQLQYAAQDIAHLPELASELESRAEALDRRWVIPLASRELLLPQSQPPVRLGFESFRNAWQLDARGQAALHGLIEWHNAQPPGTTQLQARTLLAIAGRMPGNRTELSKIKGVSPSAQRRFADEILDLLAVARRSPLDSSQLQPPDYASFDQNVREARLVLLRAELCADFSIAPEIGLPMALVRRMIAKAHEAGAILASACELSGWRKELFGNSFEQRARDVDSQPLTSCP